jgi:hypothetical protein
VKAYGRRKLGEMVVRVDIGVPDMDRPAQSSGGEREGKSDAEGWLIN